jgi:hypothetical protein
MRDYGSNVNVMSMVLAKQLGLKMRQSPTAVSTFNGHAEVVTYVLEQPLTIIIAPHDTQHRVVLQLPEVFVTDGIEGMCQLLIGTTADRDILGRVDIGRNVYLYCPYLHKGDVHTVVALPMDCDFLPKKVTAKSNGALVSCTSRIAGWRDHCTLMMVRP